MEVFTGGQQIPNPDDFPLHIAPFPEPSDLLYAHPTALIHASGITHRPISPPQKLRPIRCNVRSPVSDFHGNGGPVETLEKGLQSDEVFTINRGFGNASVILGDPLQVGSDKVDECWDPNGRERVLEDESSSSSDGSDDYSTRNFEELVNRKRRRRRRRRRKSRRKLEVLLENLVMKVMEKQEQMHKQLIEMIEKEEQERVMREEAWKQQEMERMRRDEEVRAQETSRNLALISLIQNILGQEIQTPQVQPVVFRCMEEENGAETESLQKDMKCDPNNKRWPEGEVQALIATRTSLEHKFRITGSKGSIWEEISVGMCNMGYNRTPKKCKEKWENINKYFKRSMGSEKNRTWSSSSSSRPYFHDLELLYKNGLVNPGNCFSIANNENVAKNEKD